MGIGVGYHKGITEAPKWAIFLRAAQETKPALWKLKDDQSYYTI